MLFKLTDIFEKIPDEILALPVWGQWGAAFRAWPDGSKVFNQIQRAGDDLVGIIIASWNDDSTVDQYYCASAQFYGETKFQGYIWRDFGDELESEDPLILKRLSTCEKYLEGLKEGGTRKKIGMILWKHPEAYNAPMPKYFELNRKWPGSPRH